MRSPSLLLIGTGLVGVLTGCGRNDPGGVVVYNSAPTVSITSPTSQTSVPEGQAVTFQGVVNDDGGLDELTITWSSDLDGLLLDNVVPDTAGHVELTTASLTPGNHIITLMAIDGRAESGNDFVEIGIIDLPDPPTVAVVHPAGGESGVEGEPFELVAKLTDAQDPGDVLELEVESDLDGWLCGVTADATGIARCDVTLSPGDHTLTFVATDLDGFTASVDQYFAVVPLTEIDNDGDGFSEATGDCDDDDKNIYPSAAEVFNGRDDDCDGLIDEGTLAYDDDGDGFSEMAGDCNDADPTIYASAIEVVDGKDNDCDGVIDDGTVGYDDDGDGWSESQGDCDDSDKWAYPGATEVFNGRDDDCDGRVDNNTSVYDDDGDNYCETPPCLNATGLVPDCKDNDSLISPAAAEIADGLDNNCDGRIDEGSNTFDDDGDGYSEAQGDCDDADPSKAPNKVEVIDGKDNDCNGKIDDGTEAYDDDLDGQTERQGDCNDADPSIYLGAPEIVDGKDNDCDGRIDNGTNASDDDGDGYSENQGDCNDANPAVNPGAAEICDDGLDSDCDGAPNEEGAVNSTIYYKDADNDGYGAPSSGRYFCAGGSAPWDVKSNTDCDDADDRAHPGQTAFFATPRAGVGGYDFNCNGTAVKQWTSLPTCHISGGGFLTVCTASPSGWRDGVVPACGATATWTEDCKWNGSVFSPGCTPGADADFVPQDVARTQACN